MRRLRNASTTRMRENWTVNFENLTYRRERNGHTILFLSYSLFSVSAESQALSRGLVGRRAQIDQGALQRRTRER